MGTTIGGQVRTGLMEHSERVTIDEGVVIGWRCSIIAHDT